MKNRTDQGQILPMVLLFLPVVLVLFFCVFDEASGALQKVRLQKDTDAYVYNIANDQARALNGIAALNKALDIASKRAYLMASAIAGLSACSFFSADCAKALARLLPKVKPFYDKLEKLGSSIEKQQDAMIQWAMQSQVVSLGYFNLQRRGIFRFNDDAFLGYPLHIQRASHGDTGLSGVVACREYVTQSLVTARAALQSSTSKESMANLTYEEKESQLHESIEVHPTQTANMKPQYTWPVGGTQRAFSFVLAKVRSCGDFQSIMNRIIPGFSFRLPSPYDFLKVHFDTGNKITIHGTSAFRDPMPSIIGKKNFTNELKTISQIEIVGADLMNMEFEAKLIASPEGAR